MNDQEKLKQLDDALKNGFDSYQKHISNYFPPTRMEIYTQGFLDGCRYANKYICQELENQRKEEPK